MKVKLTKRYIDSIPYTKKGTDLYLDTELTGFALRVGKQSKKYILNKRINGILYRDIVDDVQLITLTEAREKAKIMMVNISKGLGIYDGLHADNNQGSANKTGDNENTDDTVPTLRQTYLYFKKMKESKLSANTIIGYDRDILMDLEDWLDMPINSISKTMVSDKHKVISKRSPAVANSVMRTLRSVWNYAQESFLDEEEEFIIKPCPVKILNAKKDWNETRPRTKHIEEEYIEIYFKTLIDFVDRSSFKQAPHSNTTRDALIIYLFTGVRLNEALPLEWKNVDIKYGRIVFKATKNGSDYPMPAGKILHAILKERKRLSCGERWVFPTSHRAIDNHVKELRKGYETVADMSGVKVTPHDLRRTFGTVANSLNVNYPVLKKLLNHREAKSSDDVTLQYVQVSQRQLRDALNEIERYYCSKVGMTQSEVIKRLLAASSR